MAEKYTYKQEVSKHILYARPEVKEDVIIKNRRNIAYKLAEIIGDNEIHSIQLDEREERTNRSVRFIAELLIYR